MPSIAIIGTREPDANQAGLASGLAEVLSVVHNWRISTGGAFGVDLAAMQGTAPGYLTVVLPWESYNLGIIPAHANRLVFNPRIHSKWADSVNQFHPAPDRLTRGARALHARNYGIVDGANIVVAMPDESGGGGTGQGIRVAKSLGIPVIQINRGSTIMSLDDLVRQVLSRNMKERAA